MSEDAATVAVRAPAKLNLHLGVGARRPDGYHELTTVFQAVSLYDELRLSPAGELTVTVCGEGAETVPSGRENLAGRAVSALAALAGCSPAVAVAIRKSIPVAGGMAGGSADAAAALLGCDALWGLGLQRPALDTLAAALGSDVPFALHGGTALATGRGERLTTVLGQGDYHWVFALAAGGLATPAVYAELDRLRAAGDSRPGGDPQAVLAALRLGDVPALGRALHNDLAEAAFSLRPQLRRVCEAGRELGAVGSVVCGSGPTVALLTRDASDAVKIAAALAGLDVCRTVRRAVGPVAGARITAAGGGGVPGRPARSKPG